MSKLNYPNIRGKILDMLAYANYYGSNLRNGCLAEDVNAKKRCPDYSVSTIQTAVSHQRKMFQRLFL
jgi:hypothetical protein